MTDLEIPGYTYGTDAVARSPLSLDDLARLEQTVTLTEEDQWSLRLAGDVLEDQAEDLVGAWRDVIAARPHLAHYFTGPDGRPDERYKAAVKRRFVRWVIDTCRRPHDRAWLDYQEETGLRHTSARKNWTDSTQTPPFVPLRYLLAFGAVVITTVRPFLAKGGHSPEEVERMADAWCKAVVLQLTLWSRPYAKGDEW
jgi:hypothetical protein